MFGENNRKSEESLQKLLILKKLHFGDEILFPET